MYEMAIDMDREARALEGVLAKHGLQHLRVTKRGKALTLAAGTEDYPEPEARLTLVRPGTWRLDLQHHTGRWESTPFEGGLDELVETAVSIGRLVD